MAKRFSLDAPWLDGIMIETSRSAAPAVASRDQPGRPTPDGPQWFACYTRARAEKKVDGLLKRQGVESFLPLIPLRRQWHDRRKVVSWPLFPSYIFVREQAPSLGRVLMVPGIAAIVRMNGAPAVIADDEIDNIAAFAQRLGTTETEPRGITFESGERVRIVDGPFQGLEAVVVEMRGRRRVLVGLPGIRMGFEIDVPASSLKRLAPAI